jgi:two-component sensor histidine kinase
MAALAGPEHLVREVNPAFCRLLGTAREHLLGRAVAKALPPGAACRALLDRVLATGVPETLEDEECSPAEAYWSYAVWPVRGPPDRPVDLMLQIMDATGTAHVRRHVVAVNEELLLAVVRQHALAEAAEAANVPLRRREAELQQAVTDREALLREVHHRVKNNLQTLCNAIYRQMRARDTGDLHPALQATYSRIFAVARLYDQLYQGRPGGEVALDQYVGRLLGGFDGLYDAPITLALAPSDPVRLDADRGIRVGLLLTELISNALKHAFPDGASGAISVRVRQVGDRVELQVRDTGVGMPNDLTPGRSQSLGLRMVSLLAQGLNATVAVENDGGACVTVTFPFAGEPLVEPQRE